MKATIALLFIVEMVFGQSFPPVSGDPHLMARGRFGVGAVTTYSTFSPPPVIIGDITYGLSRKVSVGIVGGTQGSLALAGPKVSVLLAQPTTNFRALFRFLSIYYFERNGTFLFDRTYKQVMPWMLSMAMVDGEWKTKNGSRWSVGMGGMETHCVDGMIAFLSGKEEGEEGQAELPFELFNTVQGSFSFPLSKRVTMKIETIFVFKGTHLIPARQYKIASPIDPFLNLVYHFK